MKVAKDKSLFCSVIAFDRALDAASGDVSYTGAGFSPKVIIFVTSGHTGAAPSIGVASDADKNGRGLSVYSDTSLSYGMANVILDVASGGGGGAGQSAILKSLDIDGFTLTWTKVGAPGAVPIVCRAICFG